MVNRGESDGRYYGEHFTNEALGEIAKSLWLAGKSEKKRAKYALERQKRVNLLLGEVRKGWSNR